MTDTCSSLTPAPVTLGRASRLLVLLCQMGLDAALDAALAPEPAALPKGPVKITEQNAERPASPDREVVLPVGEMMRQIAREGALEELARIVLARTDGTEPTEGELAGVLAEDLQEALVPFVVRSFGLIETLGSCARGLA